MAKDSSYFIKIHNPKLARRAILENTRDVLRVLQGYEDFKKVRDKKAHLINSFKTDMEETRALIFEVRRSLPRVIVKEVKKAVVKEAPAERPVKEIKKIEEELADIEEKLSAI